MGYRINEHKPPKPKRTLVDSPTPAKIYIHNGEIAHLAFPCLYQEIHKPEPVLIHNSHLHDHKGWPSPGHPDHSCQHHGHIHHHYHHGPKISLPPGWHHLHKYIDLESLIPIHLTKEGYTEIQVSFNASDDQEGIEVLRAGIDSISDWVIRVDLLCEDAVYDPKLYKMSVFAIAPDRKDLAVLADLIVLPASYIEEIEDEA